MGVHVMLTGLRGFIAPFVGVFLYERGGPWVFAVSTVMCVVALFGFASMARTAPAKVPSERVKRIAEAVGSRQ